MKHLRGLARVLVATDNVDHARLLLQQLTPDFEHVLSSTDAECAVQVFEEYRPDVLVLAFDGLDKAQRYCLRLYRHSRIEHPHRTVILCHRDDAREVFELCRERHFDDYVLYWPHAYDGMRLAMSIWNASPGQVAPHAHAEPPRAMASPARARSPDRIERPRYRAFDDDEQPIEPAFDSSQQPGREIHGAIGALPRRSQGSISAREFEPEAQRMPHRDGGPAVPTHSGQASRPGTLAAEPLAASAARFRDDNEPAVAGMRAPPETAGTVRPVVLVVDDDSVAHALIGRMLGAQAYDLRFAAGATEALAQLRRGRPDVVLMDVRMPGVDGVTLMKRVKRSSHLADIPVIIMTGDARLETLKASIAAGAASFIVKPFSAASLGAKLEQVLPLRHTVSADSAG